MRALESGRFLLRATNTGISAIIDQKGGLRSVSPQFEQAILTDRVTPYAGMTPFAALGQSGGRWVGRADAAVGVLWQRFARRD